MLTGMFPPTNTIGETTQAKIYDTDIFENLEAARGYLGVCPQVYCNCNIYIYIYIFIYLYVYINHSKKGERK
jgi:hypothetical protein